MAAGARAHVSSESCSWQKMVAGKLFYVPWPDSSEWNAVKEQILSSDVQDTISAYYTILMWKLKHDSVPTYIECTYSLLQVMIKEYEMTKNEKSALLFNEHDLQLSYSTALIRFVNHVSSISSYKGETLYLAAKTQNIPDWIINMRHDVAHGQDLPALGALHIAAELSLKWLLNNYWKCADTLEPKESEVAQFTVNIEHTREMDTDAQSFFKKFFDIWELYHDAKYKKTQFITEVDREFILLLEEMLSLSNVYFCNLENLATLEIKSIVNTYNQMEEVGEFESANVCRFAELKTKLLKYLKGIIKQNSQLSYSLIMSLMETTFFLETDFKTSKWQQIIWFLQEIGSFSFLLEIFFQMAGSGHKGAARWLSVLLPSINHLTKQWAIFKVLKKETNNYKTKLLKKRIQNSSKSTEPNLVFPLDIFKPPVVSLEMVKNILMNPEQFSGENIAGFLKLVKPPLMKFTVDMIKDLVSLHMDGIIEERPEDANEGKIYTVDDFEKVLETNETLLREEASNDNDGWTKSSIDVNAWNKCPLGLLPFQSKVDCSLPDNLLWKKRTLHRKRDSIPLLKHFVSMKKFREM